MLGSQGRYRLVLDIRCCKSNISSLRDFSNALSMRHDHATHLVVRYATILSR
jgi:hypothetical protein